MVREKESKVTAPCNDYGYQEPQDGDLRGFPRVQQEPGVRALLKSGSRKSSKRTRCTVSFDISLRTSRYAVLDIGAMLSDRKIERGGTAPIVQPDAQEQQDHGVHGRLGNRGTFTGSGGSIFIIGCFGGDASIDEEKVKRPTGKDCYMGKAQPRRTTTWRT